MWIDPNIRRNSPLYLHPLLDQSTKLQIPLSQLYLYLVHAYVYMYCVSVDCRAHSYFRLECMFIVIYSCFMLVHTFLIVIRNKFILRLYGGWWSIMAFIGFNTWYFIFITILVQQLLFYFKFSLIVFAYTYDDSQNCLFLNEAETIQVVLKATFPFCGELEKSLVLGLPHMRAPATLMYGDEPVGIKVCLYQVHLVQCTPIPSKRTPTNHTQSYRD